MSEYFRMNRNEGMRSEEIAIALNLSVVLLKISYIED